MDGGAEILFTIEDLPAVIRSYSSGQKDIGIKYDLYVNDVEITEQNLDPNVGKEWLAIRMHVLS